MCFPERFHYNLNWKIFSATLPSGRVVRYIWKGMYGNWNFDLCGRKIPSGVWLPFERTAAGLPNTEEELRARLWSGNNKDEFLYEKYDNDVVTCLHYLAVTDVEAGTKWDKERVVIRTSKPSELDSYMIDRKVVRNGFKVYRSVCWRGEVMFTMGRAETSYFEREVQGRPLTPNNYLRITDWKMKPERKEDLMKALFHPDRVERMMEAYGEDWWDRID